MNQAIKERIEKIKRGEMPEGYKRTRAGISPFDWDVKPSKNLFSNYNDKNHNGDLTVLSASQEHGIIPRDKIDIDIKYNSENLKTYKKVQPGDFVISLRSFQGGIEYSEHLGLVSPAYTVLKSKPGVFNRFYRYYFKTIDFISRLNSTIYGIRDGKQIGYEDFSTLLLHNPPFREQEKIAEILSTWDKAILLMENLIEQKKKQKKWLIQNLLDPDSGVRLSGFEGEWKEKNIGDLFEFLSSVPASRDQLGNKGFCYLHYGDIHKSKKPYINVEDEYKNIPKLNIDKVPDNAILQNGDVVFVDASEDYEGASKYIVVENKFNRPFIAGLHTIGIEAKMMN